MVLDCIKGTLVFGAIGDAMGAPVELWSPEFMKKKVGTCMISGFIKTHKNDFPGQYTDDTEMTIGVVESIIEANGINKKNLLKYFAKNYNKNRGYGMITSDFLEKAADNDFGFTSPPKEGKSSNGALMRTAPLALFYHKYPDNDILTAVKKNCEVTGHTSDNSIDSCFVLCKFIQFLLSMHGKILTKDNCIKELRKIISGIENNELSNCIDSILSGIAADIPENVMVEGIRPILYNIDAMETLCLAFLAFISHIDDPMEAIKFAISYGGDTDTIAGIVGSCMGTYVGFSSIPKNLLDTLENAEYIEKLGIELYKQISINESVRLNIPAPFSEDTYI